MSSCCALRITEQGEAGPSAFTALLGRERVVAALGEHRCARSRTWGACGAPLRPRFGLICLEPISVHPPLLRKTCTRASRIAVFRLDFDARVHVLGEALCGFESLARCRKKPEPGDRHGLRASMAEREGFEAPLHAAVRCGRSHGFARFAGIRSAFPQLRTFAGFESLTCCRKKPASQRNAGSASTMAEREGFEPSRRSRAQRFSRPPHSTALPSLRGR